MRIEPPSDSSVPYLPEFWTTTLPGAWIEIWPSGSISIRVPRGMIIVGAASSIVPRLMSYLPLLLSNKRRQRLVSLQGGPFPGFQQQPFLVLPAVIQNVDERIDRHPLIVLGLAPDLIVE